MIQSKRSKSRSRKRLQGFFIEEYCKIQNEELTTLVKILKEPARFLLETLEAFIQNANLE